MSDSICNAHFIGRKLVEGPLHDRALSLIVSELMNCKTREGDLPCHLEWTDCSLLVHYIKKDEGFFESDGESVRSQDEKPSSVKRSFSEGEESDTSSANSSGTDSSDETHRNSPSHALETKAPPTFDLKESYPLNDVLICHADKDYRKCVIWIVRKGSQLEALVFQCASEGRVRDLYRQYQEGHRRSKLERQRNARKVGKRFTGSAESILEVNPKSSVHRHSANADTIQKWNLIHHTDSDGVTHIEVETSNTISNKSDKSKFTRELESILSKELKFRSPKSGEEKPPRKYDHHLSLRQRAPALLLRKFDEMEEKAYRSWSKTEEEHNRKVWSKGLSRYPKRPEISTSTPQIINSNNNNNNNNKQILVPTKTGAEPVKKLYPKDQAPSTERILRNIPTRYLAITPNPIQFASTQPHSLPIYHVGHIAWAARYPPILDYPESVWTTSVPRGSSSSLIVNRGRSRDRNSRDSLPENYRRRAQSKSPARNEGNNISRRFREFGDAVKSRMSRKSTQNPIPSLDAPTHNLKSNLKKSSDSFSSPVSMDSSFSSSQGIFGQGGEDSQGQSMSGSSDKKVHFNKFATVQMME